MGTVIRTRSVEFMPLPLSLGTFACAGAWTAYAIYVADATILVPNVLGVALALAQLALYAWFAGGSGSGRADGRQGLLDADGNAAEESGSPSGYAPPRAPEAPPSPATRAVDTPPPPSGVHVA